MLQLGHTSSQTLFRHYRGLAVNRKKRAGEYFDILPTKQIDFFKETISNAA